MRRVSVVGCSGVGKSSLARRISNAIDAPYVELDAIHHLPGWEPIDPDEYLAKVGDIAETDAWVVDGNYRAVTVDGPVWERADTVVWLDLPRHLVMRQVVGRTARRLVAAEELWNGNRERLRDAMSWNPENSIIRWSWTQHAKYRERYEGLMASPACAHLDFVRLTSHAEADAWLAGITAGAGNSDDRPTA